MPLIHWLRSASLLIALAAAAQNAAAGLPMVCHPFATGTADVLPWGASGGKLDIERHYDTARLTADMKRLLDARAPTMARMENLRRASAYAAHDRKAAIELLHGVLSRARSANGAGLPAALALFDAGYLVESYRQFGMTLDADLLRAFDKAHPGLRQSVGAMDGYTLVKRALELADQPEMQFAASLMAPDASASRRHRAAAQAGAVQGTPLAVNLLR